MPPQEKFSLLRTILKTIGLSQEATDDIVEKILDLLSEKDKPELKDYPYLVRDDFLSRAEQSFFLTLQTVVTDQALICAKVSLGDLFYVKSGDPSIYRSYTNKIDRKHVDFLLCDPKTLKPILGIELDDKSHQREDRKNRDEFVEKVFLTAKLPLVRISARQSYSLSELNLLINPHIGDSAQETQKVQTANATNPVINQVSPPCCPKCGTEMVLRTSKNGPNQGEKFWGCPNFPRCRGILKYQVPVKS